MVCSSIFVGNFVDWSPYLLLFKWPWYIWIDLGKCFVIRLALKPDHIVKWLLLIALTNVSVAGYKQVVWWYWANSHWVYFLWSITLRTDLNGFYLDISWLLDENLFLDIGLYKPGWSCGII